MLLVRIRCPFAGLRLGMRGQLEASSLYDKRQHRFECGLGRPVCMCKHTSRRPLCILPHHHHKGPSLGPGCQPIFSFSSTSEGASRFWSCLACYGDQDPKVALVWVGIVCKGKMFFVWTHTVCEQKSVGFTKNGQDESGRAIC